MLDRYGGVHPFGNAPYTDKPDFFGFNIARDIAVNPQGGYYVLDGYGGVHAKDGAPFLGPYPDEVGHYWPGWDIAKAIMVTPSGNGYVVLDGFGGIHRFGDAS